MRQICHWSPKVMVFSLAMVLLLIIIACGSTSDPTPEAASTTAPTTAATVAAVAQYPGAASGPNNWRCRAHRGS